MVFQRTTQRGLEYVTGAFDFINSSFVQREESILNETYDQIRLNLSMLDENSLLMLRHQDLPRNEEVERQLSALIILSCKDFHPYSSELRLSMEQFFDRFVDEMMNMTETSPDYLTAQ